MSTGLRERKKTETFQAINRAALALATERGPAAITVDDIAEAAGVSARTVFNYFPTKDAAILGVDPDLRSRIRDRLRERPTDEEPLVALRAAFRGVSSGRHAPPWRMRARLVSEHAHLQSASAASTRQLEIELTEVVAERCGLDPVAHPYPRLVTHLAIAALRVATDQTLAGPTSPADQPDLDVAVDTAVDEAFDALSGGLRPPPEHR